MITTLVKAYGVKFAEIKRVICNDYTDLFQAQMPGGIPPSGVSMEEVLCRTKETIFVRTKRGGAYNPAWFPKEWLVFITYGAASPDPQTPFILP
jgi:hypothetical protein